MSECKLSVLLVTPILLASCTLQMRKTDRASQGLIGDVHTVLEERSQLSGRPGRPVEGTRHRSESAGYDRNGTQTERTVYGGFGGSETVELSYYSFDSEGNRIEKSYMGGSGIPMRGTGQPPSSNLDRAPDGAYLCKRLYKLDGEGNVIEEAVYRGGGAFLYKDVYKYDNKGRRREWLTYHDGDSSTTKVTYVYVGSGVFPQREIREGVSELRFTYFTYKVDERGNWTKRIG